MEKHNVEPCKPNKKNNKRMGSKKELNPLLVWMCKLSNPRAIFDASQCLTFMLESDLAISPSILCYTKCYTNFRAGELRLKEANVAHEPVLSLLSWILCPFRKLLFEAERFFFLLVMCSTLSHLLLDDFLKLSNRCH